MTVSRREFFKIGGLSIGVFGFVESLFSEHRKASESQMKNMVANVKPLTPRDYELRLEKAKRLMRENDIDGLLLTGSTNLLYFTNVRWGRSERTFGAVLNQKEDPIWICPGFEKKRAEERIPRGHEIRTWEEDESPFRLIAGIMEDLGTKSGKLG